MAAPINGGMVTPMVEAVASKAADTCGGNPDLFISGMVSVPVPTMFAVGLPDIMPKSALATALSFAEPPRVRPMIESGRLRKSSLPPDISRIAPNTMKRNTKLAKIRVMTP